MQPASQKSLRVLPVSADKISKIIVTGYTEGPTVLKADAALAKTRAATVRAYLQARLGKSLPIEIRTRHLTKVGAYYRAVSISVWR